MSESNNWQEYWDNYLLNKYGKDVVQTEEDLYCQVARTIHKKPINRSAFEQIVSDIVDGLSLSHNDVLVDFCCGNGLFTYEVKDHVRSIIGIDFAPHIIQTARELKSADNIQYHLGEVVDSLHRFTRLFPGVRPNKYLNNDSLAYFSTGELSEMLKLIIDISGDDFRFLLRGVPNADLMWNFYNTEERKRRYYADLENGDYTNGGLGRWWHTEELSAICDGLGLRCQVKNQSAALSNYRMDVLITK